MTYIMKKNLYIAKPRYSEQILRVPRPFVIVFYLTDYWVIWLSLHNNIKWCKVLLIQSIRNDSNLFCDQPNCLMIDSLQSAFSLKIRLVLISSSAIAKHDVVITRDWDETPSFLAARGSRLNSPLACLGFACSTFAKKNKRLLSV